LAIAVAFFGVTIRQVLLSCLQPQQHLVAGLVFVLEIFRGLILIVTIFWAC